VKGSQNIKKLLQCFLIWRRGLYDFDRVSKHPKATVVFLMGGLEK
jgi:hypothetical protein